MFTQIVIFCAALVAAQANVLGYGSTGGSVSHRTQDGHGNYAFSYDIKDAKGASNSRAEVGDGWGNKKGSYTIHDIDGRARKVDYVADKLGFRAAVKTNEPGTAASAPAAALIASPYSMPVGPRVEAHIAPAAAGHAGVIGYGGWGGCGAYGCGWGYGKGIW